jgi:hypothetical protein
MSEEAKRNAKTRNENDLKFLLDINPPPEAAVESRRRVFEGYKISVQER